MSAVLGKKEEVYDKTMEFIPAGEIIGDAHQIRSVQIAQSPQLPDGEYSFIDMYCSEQVVPLDPKLRRKEAFE